MIDQLEEMVMQAVSRTFETMLGLSTSPDPASAVTWNGEPHVAGSVGFIGRLSGVVYLYAAADSARFLTGRMLGLSEDETSGDEMVNDAMGELTNMVVGQIKSQLSDRGMPCVLTIPSIVRGSHFVIETVSTTTRRLGKFRFGNHLLVVETLIKAS